MPDAPLMPLQRGSSSSCSWETTWTAKRFGDFLAGAVYLTHGDIELLNDNVLIITPDTVRVERDTFIPVSDIPMWKGPQG